MKNKVFKSAFFVLFVSLGFFSCSEEPIDPELNEVIGQDLVAPPAPSFTFKAEIDGVLFTADQAIASILTEPSEELTLISVSGFKLSTQQTISLSVQANAAGNFPLAFGTSFISVTSIGQGQSGMFSSSSQDNPNIGNINITNLDLSGNKISGTFEGTVYNNDEDETKIITNGVFTTVTLFVP